MGVISRISLIVKRVPRARSALSRPDPGPLTRTSSSRTPCSAAFAPASSAAICAANGVDLREPLNPIPPEVDHARVFPETSVIVTCVLLNVAFTWATAAVMFFLTFFFPAGRAMASSLLYFFLPAIGFAGPLRVRALVTVRCPRTGRPARWRRPR